MRPLYIGAIGLLAVLIFVLIYFTFKTTPTGKCTGPTACADTWYASDGATVVPAQQMCDLATLQIAKPNYGPGQCASPCGEGETPFYSAATKAGRCAPAGKAPGCWGDADCGPGQCKNIDLNTGMGICVCPPHYTGAHCVAGNPPGCWGDADCGPGQCKNIDPVTGMGTCACPTPYIGAHCESKGRSRPQGTA